MIIKTGLRKRKSYDEIVNIIQEDKDKIKYPDRRATFLMRTIDLDGLEEQETNIEKTKGRK